MMINYSLSIRWVNVGHASVSMVCHLLDKRYVNVGHSLWKSSDGLDVWSERSSGFAKFQEQKISTLGLALFAIVVKANYIYNGGLH